MLGHGLSPQLFSAEEEARLLPRQFTIGRDNAWRFSDWASTACVG
jgi:hypothetical protein